MSFLKSYKCAIDSNCATYLLEAMGMDYCPENDLDHKLRPERVSLFKIFMYSNDLHAVPTVQEEIERIKDKERKDSHSIFSKVVLGTVGTRGSLGEELIKNKRDDYLRNFGHKKLKDCQILEYCCGFGLSESSRKVFFTNSSTTESAMISV